MIQCVGSYAHHISVLARVALMKMVLEIRENQSLLPIPVRFGDSIGINI